jgi:hypothetical protein
MTAARPNTTPDVEDVFTSTADCTFYLAERMAHAKAQRREERIQI